MLLPEFFIYPLALILGIPIICFISCGVDGIKRLFGATIAFFLNLPHTTKVLCKNAYKITAMLKAFKITKEGVKRSLLIVGLFLSLVLVTVGIAKAWIIDKLCPYVIFVEDNNTSNDVSYKVYVALGNPVIKGEKQFLSVGETLIVNSSSKKLTYQSIEYTKYTTNRCYSRTSSTTIERGGTIKVDHYPDYFFTDPPSSIRSNWSTELVYVLNDED